MARRKKARVSQRVSRSVSRGELAEEPILKRPDGFYWQRSTGELRGPFVTRAEAEADRLAGGSAEGDFEAAESLQEAESEIGMAEWIDPDTGVPAEDHVPRLEDH
jgi:hypothetical protein